MRLCKQLGDIEGAFAVVIDAAGAQPSGGVGQQRHGGGILENVAHLLVRESRIDAGVSGPGFQRRQLRDVEMLATAGQQDRHDAFAVDEGAEKRHQGIGLLFDFGIGEHPPSGPPVARRHVERRTLRPAAHGSLKKLVQKQRLFDGLPRVIGCRLNEQVHVSFGYLDCNKDSVKHVTEAQIDANTPVATETHQYSRVPLPLQKNSAATRIEFTGMPARP